MFKQLRLLAAFLLPFIEPSSANHPSHWRALLAAPAVQHVSLQVLLEQVCTMPIPLPSEKKTKRARQEINWIKQLNEAANRLNDPSLKALSPEMDVIGDTYFRDACLKTSFVRKEHKNYALRFGK